MSENQTQFLKGEVWRAARDGPADKIKVTLENARCDIVTEILNHHTTEDGQSTTPLIIAVIQGHKDVVNTLIDLGVDLEQKGTVVYEEDTFRGAKSLWCASCWGHYDIVKLLVDNGASIDNPTDSGSTPLRPACYDGRPDIVQYLVEHGADVNKSNIYGSTCLMNLTDSGNYKMIQYLLANGADPRLKDKYGRTALHYSAEKGHLVISKLYIDNGVSVMMKDNYGVTPLMKAAINGKTEVVDYLSGLAICSTADRINALELLATSYLLTKEPNITNAHHQLMMAMQERYKNPNETITKCVPKMSAVQAITGIKECETLSELIDLQDNEIALHIEAIHIYERVIGTENDEITYPLIYTGALCVDNGDYKNCIDLWLFASKISQNIDQRRAVNGFPEYFADMLHRGLQINFSPLINSFKIAETELRLDKSRMEMNERRHKRYYEMDIFRCIYLIGVMLMTYTSKEQENQLMQAAYRFVQQKPCLQTGLTPLHICCDSESNDNDIDVQDEILFPNISLCKTFVASGANVDAQDNNMNTPLHIIAKCANADLDVISNIILCLIDNGAHVDACNIDGKTAADVAVTDTAKCVIKAHTKLSLKCISARIVKKHRIEYQGKIPESLHDFIKLH